MTNEPGDCAVRGRKRRRDRPATKFVAAVLAALVAAAAVAGGALARGGARASATGVVVVETTLGFGGGSAAGTGMVLTPSGEVLTNNHVIRGATRVKVVVPSSGRSYAARVVGYDVSHDVAVLQAVGASGLETVTTAHSSQLAVGDAVVAVGNAGGTGALASVSGSVTGVRRSITVGDDQGGAERLAGLIESDVPIRPGDSGGPLLAAGEVVGMNTAASVDLAVRPAAAAEAYAIPILAALAIAKRIESGKGSATVHVGATPFLGVRVASEGGFGGFRTRGAVVAGLVPGAPAASAGLARGDVITAIGGRAISSPRSLTSILLAQKPGAKVRVAYVDAAGMRRSAAVTLASGPPQ